MPAPTKEIAIGMKMIALASASYFTRSARTAQAHLMPAVPAILGGDRMLLRRRGRRWELDLHVSRVEMTSPKPIKKPPRRNSGVILSPRNNQPRSVPTTG